MAAILLWPPARQAQGGRTLTIAQLWLLTLLVIPGQALPPVLLWLAWKKTYYVIPFLGPPIIVGVAAVWWAASALFFSYLPVAVYALRRQWHWIWLLVHPFGTARMLWKDWEAIRETGLQRTVN
jgi:hypothetical protein